MTDTAEIVNALTGATATLVLEIAPVFAIVLLCAGLLGLFWRVMPKYNESL
jgi:hypothetical protein